MFLYIWREKQRERKGEKERDNDRTNFAKC